MADFSESFCVARFLLVINRKAPLGCHLSIIQAFRPNPGSLASERRKSYFTQDLCETSELLTIDICLASLG